MHNFLAFSSTTVRLSSGGKKAIFITIFYGYYIDEIFMITNGACKDVKDVKLGGRAAMGSGQGDLQVRKF